MGKELIIKTSITIVQFFGLKAYINLLQKQRLLLVFMKSSVTAEVNKFYSQDLAFTFNFYLMQPK